MTKKAIAVSAPLEVIQLLDSAAADIPRANISIKLLRHFFKENPSITDMSGLLSQEVVKFTFRVPEDLQEQLDEFAERSGYTRHTALLVALMASLRDQGFTPRTVARLET